MERLLSVASPLGLYAEEFDTSTGRHLGNFPQAFSHLALIEAARADHPRRATRGVHGMSAYDVIVIGSGAGGGTLVHRLAPSGKRILLLERGDWLPREPQNWSRGGRVRRQPLHLGGHLVRRRDGEGRSSRRCTTSSAAPPSSTARRSTGCARRTSASCATTTASRPPGRSATTRWSPTTRRPSSSTRCTARAARTRPSRRPARPIRSRPCRTSRASSSSPTTSPPPGTIPSTPPAGSCSTRPTWPTAPASAAPPATASRAWCTPSPTPRCWPCGRRSSTRT